MLREQKQRYLGAIKKYGTLSAGCRLAACSPNTVYQWRSEDPEFSGLEQRARETHFDSLEEEALRRGRDGVNKPVYQGGIKVGTIREYSDNLLSTMLRGGRPEKFRERMDLKHSGGVKHDVTGNISIQRLTQTDLDALDAICARALDPQDGAS